MCGGIFRRPWSASDPAGDTEFEVPDEDAEGLVSNTNESDELRTHANAPNWVKEHSGPFWVEILEE